MDSTMMFMLFSGMGLPSLVTYSYFSIRNKSDLGIVFSVTLALLYVGAMLKFFNVV